ncbi:SMI1/KNR4 family protein [Dactylosporangium cerinum]|uniref:SMI1/KNR4 family protein n=1 Tax=Dactylosporangium cerinum TaxID=1434730 RepID=A0ABV9VY31_9ACTN
MDLAAFDALAEPLRRKSAESVARHGFALVEGRTCTPDEIARVEDRMGVTFPERYKAFMMRYGGGVFGYLELFFPVDPDGPETRLGVRSENDLEFPDRDFVAVAAVGTGDYWGFPVTDGRCHEQVWFHFHDDYDRELVAADFLEFVAEYGLKSSTDRALERRNQ